MAIIRIKRTTGSNLPTGLTFGELAFIGASGGATANRLYIAGPEGVCIWVGAQILNQPTYWSGVTAETTIPTVSAVESRVVAGGGLTFASNLNVNIDAGKFFGKYKKGDVIPALGQTVKWVIEDALSETIVPGIAISFSPSTIPYGQTSAISYTVTPSYQIKTVGAVGSGSTFEWRRVGDSGWTAYPGSFHSGTETVGVTVNAVGAPFTGVTLNAGGTLDTRAFEYRFTIRDSAGATAGRTGTIAFNSYVSPTATMSLSSSQLLTAETNYVREKGNTYSNVSATITRNSINPHIPLLLWKLQYSENGSGSWLDTNAPSSGWQNATTVSSITLNNVPHNASVTANRIDYRFLVIDSNGQSTVTPTSNSGISFGFRMFYGPTASAPTTSSHIRGLPGICMATGTNAFPNPFILETGTVYNNFVVALPQGPNGLSLSQVLDLDANQANLISDYRQNMSTISVTDRTGNNSQNYTVYRYNPIGTYSGDGNSHQCTVVGSFTNP